MKSFCIRELREHVLKTYPILNTRKSYRLFFQYLLFGAFFNKDLNGLVLDKQKVLAGIVGHNSGDKWSARDFLLAFQQDVLPNFTWYELEEIPDNYYYTKSRVVKDPGFDDVTRELLKEDLFIDHKTTQRKMVYFDNGEAYNRVNASKRAKKLVSTYEDKFKDLNQTQQLISGTMNQVNSFVFKQMLGKNFKQVQAEIIKLEDEDEQLRQGKIVANILTNPPVEYLPSENAKSPRLYCKDSPNALKSDVRKSLCGGWVEFDLRSSQFAILAHILDSQPAKAFLAKNIKLWSYLSEYATGSPEYDKEDKKNLKELVYGICFGKGIEDIKRICSGKWEKLWDNEIIQDLIEKRTAWHKSIKKYGYVTDVWGNRHDLIPNEYSSVRNKNGAKSVEIKKNRDHKSLAATKIQSIELELIAEAFRKAKQDSINYQYQIMLFQHDGFTVSFHVERDKQVAIDNLQKAIRDKALSMDIDTHLDFEELPTTYKRKKNEKTM